MDNIYCFDEGKLESIRQQKAWTADPKYFKNVKIGPSAIIKMMMHGQQGVENGIRKGGKPIEVMGLLLGRPDTEDLNSLVITDAQALPIEGFETKVIADDENVINYMIELGESLEISRKERFCGWYHTHPFDLDKQSHCFLSNTDISTQLQWQRSEDPHGNPWLALVIDPLYSLAHDKPEITAFRVYPPEYTPQQNETPDGTIVADDRVRVAKWGACWNRYYKLNTTYFMSNLAKSTLGVLNDKFSWQKNLTGSSSVSKDFLRWQNNQIGNVSDALMMSGDQRKRAGAHESSVLPDEFGEESGVAKGTKSSQIVEELAKKQLAQHISETVTRSLFTVVEK